MFCRWSVCQMTISSSTLSDIWQNGSKNLAQLKTVCLFIHGSKTSLGLKFDLTESKSVNIKMWKSNKNFLLLLTVWQFTKETSWVQSTKYPKFGRFAVKAGSSPYIMFIFLAVVHQINTSLYHKKSWKKLYFAPTSLQESSLLWPIRCFSWRSYGPTHFQGRILLLTQFFTTIRSIFFN